MEEKHVFILLSEKGRYPAVSFKATVSKNDWEMLGSPIEFRPRTATTMVERIR